MSKNSRAGTRTAESCLPRYRTSEAVSVRSSPSLRASLPALFCRPSGRGTVPLEETATFADIAYVIHGVVPPVASPSVYRRSDPREFAVSFSRHLRLCLRALHFGHPTVRVSSVRNAIGCPSSVESSHSAAFPSRQSAPPCLMLRVRSTHPCPRPYPPPSPRRRPPGRVFVSHQRYCERHRPSVVPFSSSHRRSALAQSGSSSRLCTGPRRSVWPLSPRKVAV